MWRTRPKEKVLLGLQTIDSMLLVGTTAYADPSLECAARHIIPIIAISYPSDPWSSSRLHLPFTAVADILHLSVLFF